MVPAFQLQEIVSEARSRTGVPGVAAGLLAEGAFTAVADGVLELGRDEPVRADTPFRIASISKPFTASLALSCLPLDERLTGWLSHTAGLRCESAQPLPGAAEGLFSYSNAGYWAAGDACARACGVPFEHAMRERVLAPLGLAATGYEEPPAPARGHVQEGETGHRPVPRDVYPAERHPSGGLWSTVRRPARVRGGADAHAQSGVRAASRGAGRSLRARLVGTHARRRRHRRRPRGVGRRLPVAAPARAGGAACARRAHEQLARQRPRPPRGRAAGPRRGARSRDRCQAAGPGRAVCARRCGGDGRGGWSRVARAGGGDRPRHGRPDRAAALPRRALRRRRLRLCRRRPDEPPARLPAPGLCARSAGSLCRGPSVERGRRRRGPPGDRSRRRRGARRRRVGRGRRGRGRARRLRRRDGHDRPPRRRPRDLPRRKHRRRRATSTASAPFPGWARRSGSRSSSTSTCPSARSSSTTPSARPRARCPACPRACTRSGASTAACPGRGSASRRYGSLGRASRCRRHMPPAWRCSRRCLRCARERGCTRPADGCSAPASCSRSPDSSAALEALAAEGAASVYDGTIAESLLALSRRARRPAHPRRPRGVRGRLERAGRDRLARPALPHARRPLRRRPDARPPAAPARPAADRAAARARRRARRRAGAGDAHDESRRGRPRRQRVRPDVEPRPRLRATGSPASTST